MKRENLVWCGLNLVLSGALICPSAMAQPIAPETKRPTTPPLTLAELEKFIGGRTTLTLNLKDATLEEAAAAISASSGLKVQVRPQPIFTAPAGMPVFQKPPEPRYSFEATGKPFWEEFLAWQGAALAARQAQPPQPDIVLADGRVIPRRVNTDLGLFGPQQSGEALWLQPGNPLPDGRSLAQWPYLMIGTRLIRTQQGDLAQTGLRPLDAPVAAKPAAIETKRWQDGLKLDARLYLDPKIKASGMRCEIEEAVDDKGNDLRPTESDRLLAANNSGRSYSDVGGGTALSIAVHSQPNMGEKLVRLRGNLRFSVLIRSQHLELTDLANGGARNLWREGNLSVDFGGLSNVNGNWRAAFNCAGDGTLLRNLFSSPEFRVLLVDDAGQIFPSSNGVSTETTFVSLPSAALTPPKPGDSPLPVDSTKSGFRESTNRSFDLAPSGLFGLKIGRPVKIIVDLPIERREVVVPFEFTDLPLPPS